MNPQTLSLEPLTAEAFAPFGDVIQTEGISPLKINYGHTEKYSDLARLDPGADGRAALHIYKSSPVSLPLIIKKMERHPLASQAFIPLHDRPFVVVVAAAGPEPGIAAIRGFFSNGNQGVNYHKGVWHHYQITLHEPAQYLVIDRAGPGENLDEHSLPGTLMITSAP
jgi:ureidoglycolate lyase